MEQKKKPGEGTSLAPAVLGSTSKIFGVRTLEYDTRRAAEALEAAKNGGPAASVEAVVEIARPVAPPPEPKVSTWKPKAIPIPKPAEPIEAESKKIAVEADFLEAPRPAPVAPRPKVMVEDAGFLDNILKQEFEEIKKTGKALPTPMPVVPRPKHHEEEFKTPGRIVVPPVEVSVAAPPVVAPQKSVVPPAAALPPKPVAAAPVAPAQEAPAQVTPPRQVPIEMPAPAAALAPKIAPAVPPVVRKTGPSSEAPTPPVAKVSHIPVQGPTREPVAVRPASPTPPPSTPSTPAPKPVAAAPVAPAQSAPAPRAQILTPSQAIPPPIAPKPSVRPPMPGAPSVPSRPGVRVLEGLPTFNTPTPTNATMKVDTFSFPKMSSTAPVAPLPQAPGAKLPPPPAPPRRAVPIKPGVTIAPKPVVQVAPPAPAPVAPPSRPAASPSVALPPKPAPLPTPAPVAPVAPPQPLAVQVPAAPKVAVPETKVAPAPQAAIPQAPRPQAPSVVPPQPPAPVAPIPQPIPESVPREATVGGEIARLGKEVEAIELKRREIESRMAKLFVERSAIERELAPVMESVRAAAKALEESEAVERAALQAGGETLRRAEEARFARVEEKHAKDEARWAIQERLEAVLAKITAEEAAYAEEGKLERGVYDRIHALETEAERKKLSEELAKVSAERGSVESRLSELANERSRIGVLLRDLLAKEATIEQQAKAADPGDGGRRAVAQEKLIAEARYRLEKERHMIELERWKTEEALSHVHGSVTDSEKALASIRARENLIATKLKQLGGS